MLGLHRPQPDLTLVGFMSAGLGRAVAQLSQIQQWQGRLPPRLCRNRNHVTTKGVMLQIIGNSDDVVEGFV